MTIITTESDSGDIFIVLNNPHGKFNSKDCITVNELILYIDALRVENQSLRIQTDKLLDMNITE